MMNADDRGGGDRSFTQLAYAPFGGAPGAAGFGLAVWPTHAPGWPDGAPVQPRWIPINGFAPPCTPFAQLQRANAAPAMTAVWPAGGAAAWANEPTPWPAHAGVARASSAIIVDPRCVRPKRQTVVRVRVGHDDALAQALSAGANCASAAPLRAESPSAALEPGCCGTHARELPLERGALLRAAESVGIAQPHGRDDTSGAHGDASSKHTLAHVGFPTLRPTAVASAFPPRTAVHDSAWTAEEDGLLERAIREEGKHDWAAIARRVFGRTDEQCRARSRLHAQPNATHAPLDASADAGKDAMGWSADEDDASSPVSRRIAGHVPGRTERAVRSRYNVRQRAACEGSLAQDGDADADADAEIDRDRDGNDGGDDGDDDDGDGDGGGGGSCWSLVAKRPRTDAACAAQPSADAATIDGSGALPPEQQPSPQPLAFLPAPRCATVRAMVLTRVGRRAAARTARRRSLQAARAATRRRRTTRTTTTCFGTTGGSGAKQLRSERAGRTRAHGTLARR